METLKAIPVQNWIMFLLHMLDAFATFSLSFNFVVFLSKEYNISDTDATIYYQYMGILAVAVGVPSGILVDAFGIKNTLVLGSSITVCGRIFITFSSSLTMFCIAVGFTTLGSGLIEKALHISIDRYSTIRPQIVDVSFSFLYTAMNTGAMLAGILTDVYLRTHLFDEFGNYRSLFGTSTLVSIIVFGIAFVYKEPPMLHSHRGRVGTTMSFSGVLRTLRSYKSTFREKTFWVAFIITLFLIGALSMFRYLETILPLYLIRVYGDTVPYGTIQAINPTLIIAFAPIMGMLLRNVTEVYWIIVVGTFVSSISPVIVPLASLSGSEETLPISYIIVYLIIFTVGESIYSPRVIRYILRLSPVDKKGLYSGLTDIPSFAGTVLSGVISAALLNSDCPASLTTLPTPSIILADVSRCHILWIWVSLSALSTPVLLSLFSTCLNVSEEYLSSREDLGDYAFEEMQNATELRGPVDIARSSGDMFADVIELQSSNSEGSTTTTE